MAIELVQGSESYSDGQIKGRLQVRDALNPNSQLSEITWLVIHQNNWFKLEGDGQIIDFMRPKGEYYIGVRATNSKGLKDFASVKVLLGAKETQKLLHL